MFSKTAGEIPPAVFEMISMVFVPSPVTVKPISPSAVATPAGSVRPSGDPSGVPTSAVSVRVILLTVFSVSVTAAIAVATLMATAPEV